MGRRNRHDPVLALVVAGRKRKRSRSKVVQEGIEMPGPTPGGVTGKEAAEGSVMFQGDHGPVAFRNVKVTPMEFE